jgi:hypothetical protein
MVVVAVGPPEDEMVLILALVALLIAGIIVAVILSRRVRRSERQDSIAEEMTGTASDSRSRRPT